MNPTIIYVTFYASNDM